MSSLPLATINSAFLVIAYTIVMAAEVDFVKLISSDGFEFVIDRKCAMASGTIKNMLSSPGNTIVKVTK
jgi:hypothetical protein